MQCNQGQIFFFSDFTFKSSITQLQFKFHTTNYYWFSQQDIITAVLLHYYSSTGQHYCSINESKLCNVSWGKKGCEVKMEICMCTYSTEHIPLKTRSGKVSLSAPALARLISFTTPISPVVRLVKLIALLALYEQQSLWDLLCCTEHQPTPPSSPNWL